VPAPVAASRAKALAAAQLLTQHLRTHAAAPPLVAAGREWWAALGRMAFVPASLGLPGRGAPRQLLTRCATLLA
jgi:hypothetical protein